MDNKFDFNNISTNSARSVAQINSAMTSHAHLANIEHERKSLDSANLQSSADMQAEILLLLKKQADASEKESHKNTAILTLTALSAVIATISLILTICL